MTVVYPLPSLYLYPYLRPATATAAAAAASVRVESVVVAAAFATTFLSLLAFLYSLLLVSYVDSYSSCCGALALPLSGDPLGLTTSPRTLYCLTRTAVCA